MMYKTILTTYLIDVLNHKFVKVRSTIESLFQWMVTGANLFIDLYCVLTVRTNTDFVTTTSSLLQRVMKLIPLFKSVCNITAANNNDPDLASPITTLNIWHHDLAAEANSSDNSRSQRSYPKAGLIFRSSSFQLSNGTSPATTPMREEASGNYRILRWGLVVSALLYEVLLKFSIWMR